MPQIRHIEFCGVLRIVLIVLGLIVCAVATAGRLLMSNTLHMWYAFNQRADDQLLMMQSLPGYADSTDLYKLAKNQGFAYFLRFIGWSGVNVDIVFFTVWLAAALLCAVAMQRCFHVIWLSMFTYVYVLWNPLAFEDWLGTRVYRNSLFAPALFILVSGLLILLTLVWGLVRSISTSRAVGKSGPTSVSGAAVMSAPASAPGLTNVPRSRDAAAHPPRPVRSRLVPNLPPRARAIIRATLLTLRIVVIAAFAVLLGACFALIFDLKEDSIWMVPMVGFALALAAAPALGPRRFGPAWSGSTRSDPKQNQSGPARSGSAQSGKSAVIFAVIVSVAKRLGVILLCVLPAVTTYAGVQIIKANNDRDFGVSLLNTRTSGEIAGFISRIYSIDSPNQTVSVWSPGDSITKAFRAAPALRQYPEIWEYMEQFAKTPNGNDDDRRSDGSLNANGSSNSDGVVGVNEDGQLTGDFISWRMLNAIDQSSLTMRDEAKVQRVFAKANAELDRAFAQGRLKKTDKIAITPSLVPRTPDEIGELFAPSWRAYANAVTLDEGYAIGSSSATQYYSSAIWSPSRQEGLRQLNVDPDDLSPQPVAWFTRSDAVATAKWVASAYRTVNMVLIAAAVGAVLSAIMMTGLRGVRAVRRWIERRRSSGRSVSGRIAGRPDDDRPDGDRPVLAAWGWISLSVCLLIYAYAYCFFAYWYAQYLHNDRITFFYVTGLITPLIVIGLLLAVGSYLRMFAGIGREREK
ncbi:hypothetical protein [Bifidobacterium simiarum]|uniref:Uncharacterized protein n=1 Tax=Bifidobacterium simiarum TaxID=2045441 RepID=A0A2M9HF10_9BIFI|nr:hypothetical protein [Bifidobacterium simiarum]PJM75391.1 hypothetical protein CSQ87_05120 [Bifidobacterium simiarum]